MAGKRININRLLERWKEELELDNWDVRVEMATALDMRGDHGRVEIHERKQMALVWLLDPAEFNALEMRPYDPELALVHELVHVRFPAFCGRAGDHRDITAEQGVHALSKTLVRLARAAKRNPLCSSRTKSSLRKPTSSKSKAKSQPSPPPK